MRLIDCLAPIIGFTLLLTRNRTTGRKTSVAETQAQFTTLVDECRLTCGESIQASEFEEALFPVIAWVDEQMLCVEGSIGIEWRHFQLQRKLLDTSSAGDEFYENLNEIDSSNLDLLEVYAYVLALGFQGNLYATPEKYEEVYNQVFERLGYENKSENQPGWLFPGAYPEEGHTKRWRRKSKVPSLLFIAVIALPLSLLLGYWYYCQSLLTSLYSTFK